ncbi:CHAP domain-containing protein [Gordonia sp. TBRC 11910]|uniref:CHAP domain-containing protein n=1 Tax=Gordonia asplenii TaxID=2725283 RepID=A0A848KXP2_9ACTN|nr:CHAP domain-containing protein [Gordonia asplenii]
MVVAVVAAAVVGWRLVGRDDGLTDRVSATLGLTEAFPDVDTTGLTPARRRIVDVVRHEYDHKQSGTYYAQGATEPWCADFVSWTMHEAGVPLDNPNSGSWRIPGVATLTDYYRSVGRLRAPSYRPRTGDVVLYETPNRFRQHTNIVLKVDGDTVTTVGGNEPPTSISINSYDAATVTGIVGYGVVESR